MIDSSKNKNFKINFRTCTKFEINKKTYVCLSVSRQDNGLGCLMKTMKPMILLRMWSYLEIYLCHFRPMWRVVWILTHIFIITGKHRRSTEEKAGVAVYQEESTTAIATSNSPKDPHTTTPSGRTYRRGGTPAWDTNRSVIAFYLQWYHISFVEWTLLKFFNSISDNHYQQVVRQLGKSHTQWLIHKMMLSVHYCVNFEFISFLWEF